MLVKRIQKNGIDLSALSFIPEQTKIPLQRDGVDTLPQIAQWRAT